MCTKMYFLDVYIHHVHYMNAEYVFVIFLSYLDIYLDSV